jgi:hypothetical protein
MEEKRKEIEIGGILLQMSGTPSLESNLKFGLCFQNKKKPAEEVDSWI